MKSSAGSPLLVAVFSWIGLNSHTVGCGEATLKGGGGQQCCGDLHQNTHYIQTCFSLIWPLFWQTWIGIILCRNSSVCNPHGQGTAAHYSSTTSHLKCYRMKALEKNFNEIQLNVQKENRQPLFTDAIGVFSPTNEGTHCSPKPLVIKCLPHSVLDNNEGQFDWFNGCDIAPNINIMKKICSGNAAQKALCPTSLPLSFITTL